MHQRRYEEASGGSEPGTTLCLVWKQSRMPWTELKCIGMTELTTRTVMMSVNQMTAQATLTMAHKIIITGKPQYLCERMLVSGSRLKTKKINRRFRFKLTLTSEGFLEKAESCGTLCQ